MKKQNLLLAFSSVVITLLVCAIAGQFIKTKSVSANKFLVYQAWMLKHQYFGTYKKGLWQNDELLGWKLKASNTYRHFKLFNFDVTYHIDKYGHRKTGGDPSNPKVVFLGGSYTFGNGVEDNETFASILQKRNPKHCMINTGANAWGTDQALIKLKEQFQQHEDIELVVYNFIGAHVQRNYLRKPWLKKLWKLGKRQKPYFKIDENGKLNFAGLATWEKDGICEDKNLDDMEIEITKLLLVKMRELCDSSETKFKVAYLPSNSRVEFKNEIASTIGSENLWDFRSKIDFENLKFKLDGHPNADGHRAIAELMDGMMKDVLEKSDLKTAVVN